MDISCPGVYEKRKSAQSGLMTGRILMRRLGNPGEPAHMSEDYFYAVKRPLDAIPTGTQMRTANFVGFAPLVRKLGGDPRWILEQHGLDPLSIRDPDSYID